MSLAVETSQSEVQELRVAADYQREVQSILVKAFGQVGSASAAESEFAERQLVTVVVRIQYNNSFLAIFWLCTHIFVLTSVLRARMFMLATPRERKSTVECTLRNHRSAIAV